MLGTGRRRSRGWATPAGALIGAVFLAVGPATKAAAETAVSCLIACPGGGPATVTLKRSIYTLS
ncbi:MAG: hypothetical protein VXX13_08585, partial [Pseudomonadota bacterium]|nr:hypothetical protein [Pseudomonadota bacterium]